MLPPQVERINAGSAIRAQISHQMASRLAAKLATSPVLDSSDAFRMHLTPLVGSTVYSFNFGVESNIDTFDSNQN